MILLPALGIGMGYGIVQQCGTCEPLQSPTEHPIRKDAFGWEGERPEGNN